MHERNLTMPRWSIDKRRGVMKRRRTTRASIGMVAVLGALAFAVLASGAGATGDYPANGDTYLVSRQDTTPLTNAIDEDNFFLWIRLKEAFADQVFLKEIPATLFNPLQLGFLLPAGRTLRVAGEEYPYACHTEDGTRKLVCGQLDHLEIHMRLGDLNDTFVSDDLPYSLYIEGGEGRDYIRTARAGDRLSGDSGNDALRGGAGRDSLYGGEGDDLLDGGDGSDTMSCGPGNDRVEYQGRTSALTIKLDSAVLTSGNGASGEEDTIRDCENVTGWNGADTIVGSDVSNKLEGRDGNDNIKGGSGNDRLSGGNGKDSLSGEAGGDTIYGDAGDDTISGGEGSDTVYGGDGNDTINVKDGVRDTVICGAGGYDSVVYDVGIDEIDIGSCERRN